MPKPKTKVTKPQKPAAASRLQKAVNSSLTYLEQARTGKTEWWRFLLVPVISIIGGTAIAGGIVSGLFYITGLNTSTASSSVLNIIMCLVIFFVVAGMFVVLFKLLHKRTLDSLLFADKVFNWQEVFVGFLLWLVIYFATALIQLLIYPGTVLFRIPSSDPVVLLMLLIGFLASLIGEIVLMLYGVQFFGLTTKSRINASLYTAGLAFLLQFPMLLWLGNAANTWDASTVIGLLITPVIVFGLSYIAVETNGIEVLLGMVIALSLSNMYINIAPSFNALQALNTTPLTITFWQLISTAVGLAIAYKVIKYFVHTQD